MSKRNLLILIFATAVIGGSIAYASSTIYNPKDIQQSHIRDLAMEYIKENHAEAAAFIDGIQWTGGRVTPLGLVGAETYRYTGGGWDVTIRYAVVREPVYNIEARFLYSRLPGYVGIPYNITWRGQFVNGTMVETDYVVVQ